MKHKHELINLLIEELKIGSYLEIGLGPLQETWKFINCAHKECVDIEQGGNDLPTFLGTSDDFFKSNTRKFGLIYIDGDHSYEQVRKDFLNSLNNLEPGGIIVMHDIAPQTIEQTSPRSSGDAFRFFTEVRRNPLLTARTHFFPSGDAVGIVYRYCNESPLLHYSKNGKDDFDFYLEHKEDILMVEDVRETIKKIKANRR
jgi:hypothetical protein